LINPRTNKFWEHSEVPTIETAAFETFGSEELWYVVQGFLCLWMHFNFCCPWHFSKLFINTSYCRPKYGKYWPVTVYRTRTPALAWSANAICLTVCRCILALCKKDSSFCTHSWRVLKFLGIRNEIMWADVLGNWSKMFR